MSPRMKARMNELGLHAADLSGIAGSIAAKMKMEKAAFGARVIYYWAVRKDLILLLFAYPKNVSADLTPKQVAQLAKVAKEFNVPAVLTAVETESFSGYLWPQLLDVFSSEVLYLLGVVGETGLWATPGAGSARSFMA